MASLTNNEITYNKRQVQELLEEKAPITSPVFSGLVSYAGNVGIGTLTPESALTVCRNLKGDGSTGEKGVHVGLFMARITGGNCFIISPWWFILFRFFGGWGTNLYSIWNYSMLASAYDEVFIKSIAFLKRLLDICRFSVFCTNWWWGINDKCYVKCQWAL